MCLYMFVLANRRLSAELSGDAQLKKLREQLREEQNKVEKLQKVSRLGHTCLIAYTCTHVHCT